MKNKQNGMVLIVVVSILALLSLMSVTFVRMMVYEQVAASNSGANSNARLIAQCGIEEAKARLWKYLLTAQEENSLLVSTESSLFSNKNASYDNFWYPIPSENKYYDLKTAVCNNTHDKMISLETTSDNNPYRKLHENSELKNIPHHISGCIGIVRQRRSQYFGSYEVNGNCYALKIEDNQGKLNINSHRPQKITLPDTATNEEKETAKNNYLTRCQYSNAIMNNLIKRLAINCNLSESTATEIAKALRPLSASEPPLYTNLSNVQKIVERNAGTEDTSKFLYNICINSWMDKKTQVPSNISRKTADKLHNIAYYIEYRSPININTVSLELLTTIIEEVGATVFTYESQVTGYDNDAIFKDPILEDSSENPMRIKIETELKNRIIKNTYQFTHNTAENIASLLIGDSNPASGNRKKYYNFHELNNAIDDIVSNYWGVSEESLQYISDGNDRRAKLIALEQPPKDVLKANFNPNVRENTVNCTANNFINVVKGDLYLENGNISSPSHTTELCFWCNGYASITSLGMITANNHNTIIEESIINEQVAFGDWVTHTTQHDFFSNNVRNEDEAAIENPNTVTSNCTINNSYVFPDEIAEKELEKIDNTEVTKYSASKNSGWIEIIPNTFTNDLPYQNTISGSESSQLFMAMKKKITIPNDSIEDNIIAVDYKNLILKNNSEYNSSNAIVAASNYNRANSTSSASELNYKRNIKFWMKFNGNILLNPYKSGIYAETRFSGQRYYIPYNWDMVAGTTTANAPKLPFHEGSQLFIYKNTNNQLRISTTYFCSYYVVTNKGGEYQGIAVKAGEGNGYYGLALGVNQDYTTDPNWKYARLDGIINLDKIATDNHWQQNSWHHFNITTDSNAGSITCLIDGSKIDTAEDLEVQEQSENDELHPHFCIANEMFNSPIASKKSINGFQRKQINNDKSEGESIIFRESPAGKVTSFLSNGVMAGYNTDYTTQTRYSVAGGTFRKTISTTINNIEWTGENTQYHPDWAIVGMLSWIGYSQDPSTHITVTSTQHKSNRITPEDNRTYDMLAPSSNNQTTLSTTYTINLTPDNNESPVVDSVSLQVLFPQVISSEVIE